MSKKNKKSKASKDTNESNLTNKTKGDEHHRLLNFEIAEKFGTSLLSIKTKLFQNKSKRSRDEDIAIENRLLDEHQDNDNIVFRGMLDATSHYLIWILVILMPIFVPYIRSFYGKNEAPGLAISMISFMIFMPLSAFIYAFANKQTQQKNSSSWGRLFNFAVATLIVGGLYTLACHLGVLPRLAFATTQFINSPPTKEHAIQAWFSTFSNGKFLVTYLLTILITTFFLMQQYFNRDRVVLRLPLRKIFFFFFLMHFLSYAYPLVYSGESSSFEVTMRIHQWAQYFLLFIIIVNSMTSLGRILSISKAASFSGLVVALIGIAQYFFSRFTQVLGPDNKTMVDAYESFVSMRSGQPAFSTFGQNNFSAAYVCLSIPITIALLCSLSARLILLKGDLQLKSKFRDTLISMTLWSLSLIAQIVYLMVSMGKAGIVSMVGAVAITAVIGFFILEPRFKKLLLRTIAISSASTALLIGLSLVILYQNDTKAQHLDETVEKWQSKLSKTFDTAEGSNRVRIFYVGSAFRIMKTNALSMLVGVGANNYKIHYPLHRHPEESRIEKGKHVNQAHCDYAQHASDLGLMGFFLFMLLMIYPLVIGVRILVDEKNIVRRFIGLGFYCTLLAMSINSLFFFPFQTPGSLLPYFVSLGLLFSFQRHDIDCKRENKITFILVSLLALAFLGYESWFSATYYKASSDIWLINILLVLLAWGVILMVRKLVSLIFAKDKFITTIKADPVLLTTFIVCYAITSYLTTISYIRTDFIQSRFLKNSYERIYPHMTSAKNMKNGYVKEFRRGQNQLKDKPNEFKKFRAQLDAAYGRQFDDFMNHNVEPYMSAAIKSYEEAIGINSNNPEIYNSFTTALQIYFDILQYGNGYHSPYIEKYGLNEPIFSQENIFNKIIENKQIKLWPNNKNYYSRLAKIYNYYYQRYPSDNPMRDKAAAKMLEFSGRFIHINPNDDKDQSQGHRGDMLLIFIEAAKYLGELSLVEDFYNDRIKENWAANHDICIILANHFKQLKSHDLELEARVHSFKNYPKNSSRYSHSDFKTLHELLIKSRDDSGKAKYPNGIADILSEKRLKGTTLEYLSNNIQTFVDYRAFADLMHENKYHEKLKPIQERQLKYYMNHLDLDKEKEIFKYTQPNKDFDNYITTILTDGTYKYKPQDSSISVQNFEQMMTILSRDSSSESLEARERLINREIIHNFHRRYRVNGKNIHLSRIKELKKYYDDLNKDRSFKDFLYPIIDSGRIAAPNEVLKKLKEEVESLS